MKKLIFLILLAAPGLLPGQSQPEFLVQFKPGYTPASRSLGEWELLRPIVPRLGIYLYRGEPERAAQVQKLDFVQQVVPDQLLEPRSTSPDDPSFPSQWGLDLIQAPEVWDYATGGATFDGKPIVAAVLDSGFDLEHPDLADNLWVNAAELNGVAGVDDDANGYADDIYGWNFRNNSPNHLINAHGISVTGILAARGNNGEGVSGVNWNIQWMPLTVETVGDILEAYEYVRQQREAYNQSNGAEGALVVTTNASLGITNLFCDEFPGWNELYDDLGEAGVLNVAATANENQDVDIAGDVPTTCASPYLISVTNTDRFDQKVPYAAYGSISIDLGAPGGTIEDGTPTTGAFGNYDENFSGTSAACPHVAGGVALLFSLPSSQLAELIATNPQAAADLVRDAILQGVDPAASLEGITVTGGRLNLFNSMKYIHGYFQPPVPGLDPLVFTEKRDVLRYFPNPAPVGTELEVVFSTVGFQSVHFRLYNALGQLAEEWGEVAVSPFGEQRVALPTSRLGAGVWLLVLDNGISPVTKKLVVY